MTTNYYSQQNKRYRSQSRTPVISDKETVQESKIYDDKVFSPSQKHNVKRRETQTRSAHQYKDREPEKRRETKQDRRDKYYDEYGHNYEESRNKENRRRKGSVYNEFNEKDSSKLQYQETNRKRPERETILLNEIRKLNDNLQNYRKANFELNDKLRQSNTFKHGFKHESSEIELRKARERAYSLRQENEQLKRKIEYMSINRREEGISVRKIEELQSLYQSEREAKENLIRENNMLRDRLTEQSREYNVCVEKLNELKIKQIYNDNNFNSLRSEIAKENYEKIQMQCKIDHLKALCKLHKIDDKLINLQQSNASSMKISNKPQNVETHYKKKPKMNSTRFDLDYSNSNRNRQDKSKEELSFNANNLTTLNEIKTSNFAPEKALKLSNSYKFDSEYKYDFMSPEQPSKEERLGLKDNNVFSWVNPLAESLDDTRKYNRHRSIHQTNETANFDSFGNSPVKKQNTSLRRQTNWI